MLEADPADRPKPSRMTLRKHLRHSILVGAAVALPAAGFILWGAIAQNPQLEFYDTGTGEVFWAYIILQFVSMAFWFQMAPIMNPGWSTHGALASTPSKSPG